MKVICFDLDDTLSKEIDYLHSAYWEIACFAMKHRDKSTSPESLNKAYRVMLSAYYSGENAFKCLNDFLDLELPISNYLSIYHNHQPKIKLSEETLAFLEELKSKDYVMGLITDGRSVQQRHKIKALGLWRFFREQDIIISEEFGTEKPTEANYTYFISQYPHAQEYIYIGDNPQKDFLTPNYLNWQTIGLLDDGRNIHKQDFNLPKEYMPKKWVKHLSYDIYPF